MPVLHAVATAVPEHRVDQEDLHALAAAQVGDEAAAVFANGHVRGRNLAMPVPWYLEAHGFKDRMAAFADAGYRLVADAAQVSLDCAGLAPRDVDAIVFACTTGMATPSLDARLAGRLGFRSDVRRVPVWGLGCAAGTAAVNRAADFARADPDAHVLLVALELCTLSFDVAKALGSRVAAPPPSVPAAGRLATVALPRIDKKSLVAASLFGDGCAAAVVSGDRTGARGLRHVSPWSHLWPDSERVMGWDVEDHNLDVVLSPRIPEFVHDHLGAAMGPWLARHGRPQHWAMHPGGAKVLDAYRAALQVSEHDLRHARDVLRQHGNMSSPTVLFVLDALLRDAAPRPGERVVMAALGPGFAAEATLLEA